MLWILITEISQRIYGIAGLWHGKLYIAGPEVKIIFNGELYHSEPIKLMN